MHSFPHISTVTKHFGLFYFIFFSLGHDFFSFNIIIVTHGILHSASPLNIILIFAVINNHILISKMLS